MRIAAIDDIHGNLPALKAVLADIERIEPDLIVVGGDIAPLSATEFFETLAAGRET